MSCCFKTTRMLSKLSELTLERCAVEAKLERASRDKQDLAHRLTHATATLQQLKQ